MDKYPPGSHVKGKIRNLTSYGAFVELEDGIDGMIHVSDISWTRKINHPSEVLRRGDDVEAVVLEVDRTNQRIALGKREAQKTEAMSLKQRLEALTISIGAHAGEEGKLCGSVTNIDIERALREKGFDVERRKIVLAEPIKQLGEFTVPVKLQPDVEASLKVEVKAE